jgi:Flp pilus assembly protein CpaB
MKLRIILLILAIIIAGGAVFGVITYINSITASYEEGVEEVEVLVAAQNIPKEVEVETLISAGMVEKEGIPRIYLAEGVLTSLDEYKGYVVAAPINKGEQITTTKFIKPEEIGLAFIVPDGMIAVSIPVDEIIGVSNLIDVGDRVNVIATFFPEKELSVGSLPAVEEEQSEEGSAGSSSTKGVSAMVEKDTTKTLLWNVEVLYIGTRVQVAGEEEQTGGIFGGGQSKTDERSSEEIKTVTLAVTPEDSEKLVFSEELGSIWLALVPTDGIEEEETTGSTLDNIFID